AAPAGARQPVPAEVLAIMGCVAHRARLGPSGLTMHVSVTIVAFRNADDVAQCLEALARSTHTDFEVVVCENGGPEAFAVLQDRLPRLLPGGQRVKTVLAPSNLGYAGGVNACINQSARADAWWVLNPDPEPHPEAMALQVRRLEQGDCDAVGCRS